MYKNLDINSNIRSRCGHKFIAYHSQTGRWCVRIKGRYIGYYYDVDEAVRARDFELGAMGVEGKSSKGMKKCPEHGWLPREDFYDNPTCHDGKASECKTCTKQKRDKKSKEKKYDIWSSEIY